VLINENA
jgi:hypothetical protein